MLKKARKARKPSANVKTIAAVGRRLYVDERTVKTWLAAGCPGEAGAYDVEAIAEWRAENRRPARQTVPEGERAKYAASREKAQAKREWLKLRRERGDLILVSRAAQVMRQHVAEVVTHLDQLPDFAVAGQGLPAETKKKIRDRLKARIRDMRLSLEKSLKEMARTAKRDGEAESDE